MVEHETLSPEYRGFLQDLVKIQVMDLAPDISIEDFSGKKDASLEFLVTLKELSIIDQKMGLDMGSEDLFLREAGLFRSSGGIEPILHFGRLMSNYYLSIGNTDRSGMYLEDMVYDAFGETDEDRRTTIVRRGVGKHVKKALELGEAEHALVVVKRHRSDMVGEGGVITEDASLLELAMASVEDPDLFTEVNSLLDEAGYSLPARVFEISFKVRREEVSKEELLGSVREVESRTYRAIILRDLADFFYEQENVPFGDFFAELVHSEVFDNDEAEPEDKVVLAYRVLPDVFHHRPDLGTELIVSALEQIKDIDDFAKMKGAYGDLFGALVRVSESAETQDAIPSDQINMVYDHAMERFADPSNFLEIENVRAVCLYPKDPAPAQQLLQDLDNSWRLALQPDRKFALLSSLSGLHHSLILQLVKHGKFEGALELLNQRIDVEEETDKLVMLNTNLRRRGVNRSLDETRTHIAFGMAKSGSNGVSEVVSQMTDVAERANVVRLLFGLVEESAPGM